MPERPSVSGLVAKLVALFAPPVLFGAGVLFKVHHNLFRTIALVVGYWLVLGIVGLVSGVGGVLKARWQRALADAIDRWLTAVLVGYRRKYLQRLGASVRDVELLGVATQGEYVLRLHQVYVELSLAPQPPQNTSGEPFVGKLSGSGERRTLDWFIGEADHQVFAVIGGPGSGKTTLVRRAALDRCQHGMRRRPLPVLLYLRDHSTDIVADDAPDLARVAAASGWLEGTVPADWIQRRLDRGGCLVMLDGLDEVTDEAARRNVVTWVKRQIQRYPDNTYVITSRPHGYLSSPLGTANVLQVRRLTGEQISRFLHGWYYAIECRAAGDAGEQVRARAAGKADDLLARLRDRPALYDLAANPLLLTMIANVHRYRDALPGSRAALYGEMCEVLLHRRQEAKGLNADTGLRGEQKEGVVRTLALQMMTEKISSIGREEACRAIQPALQRVSATVTPQAFLAEVHKSGLLVERERGVYAFAHLTLQEYLAAAQIKEDQRLDLLALSVDNPWWRETTLLWAASADATPIIRSCLESGSVRSLALAFDCADEAREIDRDTRRKLEDLLTSPTGVDEATDRLITAVRVARSLRDVIWLGEATRVSARPVTKDIYALFTQEENTHGRHHPTPGEAATNEPAIGMWANDAVRFVDWVNGLFDDDTAVRLPTRGELEDPAIGLVTDLTRHSVWAQGDPRPLLHCPNALPHPYISQADRIRRFPSSDRRQTSGHLLVTLTLARNLDLDRVLDLDRALDLDLDRAFDLSLDLSLDLDRALDRDRAVDLARALARDLDLDQYLSLDPDHDSALTTAHVRMLVVAYFILITLWTARENKKPKIGQALTNFDAFLESILPEVPVTAPTLPEDVATSIRRTRELLEASSHRSGRDTALRTLACRVTSDVHDLVAPMLTRSAPYDPDAIPCARIGLLAAAAVASHLHGRLSEKEGALVLDALRGLTAVQERADGGLTANEVLILARA